MYFYEIEVYYPFYENEKIIMGHDAHFDNHQLNIIVQEAFDECIDKYSNKTLLDECEEPCRMAVEIIFKEYLPAQLQNHGFSNIKIDETCSIMDGELFLNDGAINPVLKKRYLDKALPPCKKCIRDECIVPNTRKDNSLPTTRVVKTISINLNEEDENKEDFNISVLKQYFINSNKSVEDSKIADAAIENILKNNDFKGYWTEWGVRANGIHEGDLICSFDLDADKERCKKLLEKYGFIFEDTKDGLWITGVKE